MSLHTEPTRRRSVPSLVLGSVNLEHDRADAEKTRPFILTACARRAIQRISDGLSSPASPRAWTLTGPFGTGKSSFCVFLSNLLSPSSASPAGEARRLLKAADSSLDASLRGVLANGKGLIPVAITG